MCQFSIPTVSFKSKVLEIHSIEDEISVIINATVNQVKNMMDVTIFS